MSATRSFAGCALRIEQHPLALHAPAIAAELAGAAHDAMTRDQQGDAVRCASARDGASCTGLADCFGNFRVRAHLAVWQLLQIAPYDQLERGTAHVQRQIEPRLDAAQVSVERRHPRFELLL